MGKNVHWHDPFRRELNTNADVFVFMINLQLLNKGYNFVIFW
jgi:hypothetical protein